MDPTTDPRCPKCLQDNQTLEHWVLECPATLSTRQPIFGDTNTVLTDNPIKAIELAKRCLWTRFGSHAEKEEDNTFVNTYLSHKIDIFITLQQQLQHPQTLTIHQLSQSIISSNPSNPTPSSNYTLSPNTNPSSKPTSSCTNRAYRRSNQVFQSLPTIQSR